MRKGEKVTVSEIVYGSRASNQIYTVTIDGERFRAQDEVEYYLGISLPNFVFTDVVKHLDGLGYKVSQNEIDVS